MAHGTRLESVRGKSTQEFTCPILCACQKHSADFVWGAYHVASKRQATSVSLECTHPWVTERNFPPPRRV